MSEQRISSIETPLYVVRAQPLTRIVDELRAFFIGPSERVLLRFPNPKSPAPLFEGELYRLQGEAVRFRSLQSMIDLAQLLKVSFTLDRIDGAWCEASLRVRSKVVKSWHESSAASGETEKYGAETTYAKLNKLEDPNHFRDLERVYQRLVNREPEHVLSLGCNQGDELWAFWRQLELKHQTEVRLIGVDHSRTAIEVARSRYPLFDFRVEDISRLNLSDFAPVDLLIALNVLHSPSLRGHELFKSWVKGLLSPSSSVLVGLPNCRYHGYEARYGAVSKHGGSINDMSQLLSEVQFYTRYLRQQGFTVWVTGERTVYVVGRREK